MAWDPHCANRKSHTNSHPLRQWFRPIVSCRVLPVGPQPFPHFMLPYPARDRRGAAADGDRRMREQITACFVTNASPDSLSLPTFPQPRPTPPPKTNPAELCLPVAGPVWLRRVIPGYLDIGNGHSANVEDGFGLVGAGVAGGQGWWGGLRDCWVSRAAGMLVDSTKLKVGVVSRLPSICQDRKDTYVWCQSVRLIWVGHGNRQRSLIGAEKARRSSPRALTAQTRYSGHLSRSAGSAGSRSTPIREDCVSSLGSH